MISSTHNTHFAVSEWQLRSFSISATVPDHETQKSPAVHFSVVNAPITDIHSQVLVELKLLKSITFLSQHLLTKEQFFLGGKGSNL